MAFRVSSHVDTRQDVFLDKHIHKWVNEKGYFSQELIVEEINRRLRDRQEWPGNGKYARATFDRIANVEGQGISDEKFVAEFASVLDTTLPASDDLQSLGYSGFLRALASHIEINPLFNIQYPHLKSADRDGLGGYKVHTDPPKTASDLRRLLFRGLASPLPQSEEITGRTHIPVLQFVWHEHEQNADGKLADHEHRWFQLEDERTIELQDMLAISRTKLIDTGMVPAFSRHSYKAAIDKLMPLTLKHDLRQLGVRKGTLVSLVSLLSTIDPHRPGLQIHAGSGSFDMQYSRWSEFFADAEDYVEYERVDELLRIHMPHFYLQLSKLIGLLMVERSADGGYAGELDPTKIELPPADVMQYRLRMFTVSERFKSRELEDNFVLNATNVVKPLYGGCLECWKLGLVNPDNAEEEEVYITY